MEEFSVLIVDDSPSDRYLLKNSIVGIPVISHILECDSADKALESLSRYKANRLKYGDQFPPMLIFLDVNMPGMNGLEFLDVFQDLKAKHEEYQSCVVIMYTSSDRKEERKRALQCPFVLDFLRKGDLDKETLEKRIRELVKRC